MRAIVICLFVVSLGACASAKTNVDGEGPDHEASFELIQSQIFDQACATAGCHDSTTLAGSLNLSSADASYQSLVEVMADNSVAAENRWMRVKPGEPDLSFLIRKLELPGIGEGAPMPVGEMELTDYYVAMISEWIALGAER